MEHGIFAYQQYLDDQQACECVRLYLHLQIPEIQSLT